MLGRVRGQEKMLEAGLGPRVAQRRNDQHGNQKDHLAVRETDLAVE